VHIKEIDIPSNQILLI